MEWGRPKELLVIMPTYNEEKNISALLQALSTPEIRRVADVLVINDASRDGTGQVVRAWGNTMVTDVFNLGYGSALQLGYKYAVNKGYRYVIQMDADGQHDVCNVLKLWQELKVPDADGEYPDIVLGSRFMEGSSSFPVPFLKRFAFWLFRGIVFFTTGRRLSDPTTGLQGLSRRTFRFYAGYGHFDSRYPDANMLIQMLLLGFRIREIPAVMHARKNGASMHSGLKPAVYMVRMIFSILAVYFRIKVLKMDTEGTEDEAMEEICAGGAGGVRRPGHESGPGMVSDVSVRYQQADESGHAEGKRRGTRPARDGSDQYRKLSKL